MSNFDMGFAIVSFVLALLLIARSPFYRAIVRECIFHPCSDGWIDVDGEGKVQVYRGESLPDYMLEGALQALQETQEAVTKAESKASTLPSASAESSNWRSYANAAAAAGIGFLSAYLFSRENRSPGGEK